MRGTDPGKEGRRTGRIDHPGRSAIKSNRPQVTDDITPRTGAAERSLHDSVYSSMNALGRAGPASLARIGRSSRRPNMVVTVKRLKMKTKNARNEP